MASNSRVWSVMSMASALAGAMLAKKALTTSWTAATGKKPPGNPAHPDVSVAEGVAWAIASGAAIGVARMLAARKAAEYYYRSTGHLPPNMERDDA